MSCAVEGGRPSADGGDPDLDVGADTFVADATTADATLADEIAADAGPRLPCNGAPLLCDRRYDEVGYLTTHNAMANAEDGFAFPNQRYGIPRQLADGVRGFLLDTHDWGGEVYLCHADCALLGRRPLVEACREIASFLRENPREVVSVLFESYVSGAQTHEALRSAGLLPFVHAHEPDTPWPTLAELVARGERLVLFTDRDAGAFPGYHDIWAHAFETHWQAATAADFSCRPNRGSPSHALFLLNHFLTNPLPHEDFAREVNAFDVLSARALACAAENDRLANFVAVDFYSLGDARAVVDSLNGL